VLLRAALYKTKLEIMADPVMNEQGLTELHLAAYHGELDWMQNCLRGGLDVHARDKGGYTPLHWAADMGLVGPDKGEREAIVDALIQASADVNSKDFSGRSVLAVARSAGNENIVRWLIAAGAEDECRTN
jgi:uncharacterized protein